MERALQQLLRAGMCGVSFKFSFESGYHQFMDSRRRAILAAGLGLYAARAFPQMQVKLPKIGLGTWQTFDVGNDSAAHATLSEVLKLLDGNVVNSSPMYGTSESVAGDLIAELAMRERLFVATKVWTSRSEERRVGKSVDLVGRRIIKKKKKR